MVHRVGACGVLMVVQSTLLFVQWEETIHRRSSSLTLEMEMVYKTLGDCFKEGVIGGMSYTFCLLHMNTYDLLLFYFISALTNTFLFVSFVVI